MSKWFEPDEIKSLIGEEFEDEKKPLKDNDIPFGDYPKEEVETKAVKFEEFTEEGYSGESAGFELLYDIPLEVRVVLGSVTKTVEEILELEEGSVVQLDRAAGEPVEVMVGDQVIAKGETVIIDDKFGVLITEVVSPRERIKTVENKLKRQRQI